MSCFISFPHRLDAHQREPLRGISARVVGGDQWRREAFARFTGRARSIRRECCALAIDRVAVSLQADDPRQPACGAGEGFIERQRLSPKPSGSDSCKKVTVGSEAVVATALHLLTS
jgi:hypothetical protein